MLCGSDAKSLSDRRAAQEVCGKEKGLGFGVKGEGLPSHSRTAELHKDVRALINLSGADGPKKKRWAALEMPLNTLRDLLGRQREFPGLPRVCCLNGRCSSDHVKSQALARLAAR